MNIRLKNIGIIKDSTIEINGLTVITGKNNSGKTIVSKALYSLIDSVENIKQKSVNDRYNYAVSQMEKACECFPFHFSMKRGQEQIENECIKIFFSGDYDDSVFPEKVDIYISDLIHELEDFDITCEPYKSILERFRRPPRLRKEITKENFETYKEEAISILSMTREYIMGDIELINYAKQSINATLAIEFNGQIQPVALENVSSFIEIYDKDELYFKVDIKNNEISEDDDVVYWVLHIKRLILSIIRSLSMNRLFAKEINIRQLIYHL